MLKLVVSVGSLLAFLWFVTWLAFYIRRQILAIRADEQRRKNAEWQESVRQMNAINTAPLLWSPVKEDWNNDALPTQEIQRRPKASEAAPQQGDSL